MVNNPLSILRISLLINQINYITLINIMASEESSMKAALLAAYCDFTQQLTTKSEVVCGTSFHSKPAALQTQLIEIK